MSQLPRPISEAARVAIRGHEVGAIRFWPLTDEEEHRARSIARREAVAVAREGTESFDEIYAITLGSAVLAVAMRSADDVRRPVFQDSASTGVLSVDEQTALLRMYRQFREGVGPALNNITSSDMDAWIAALSKGADVLALDAWRWGSADALADVAGLDTSSGFLDCHFLSWIAAREQLYPEVRSARRKNR
jgi:hypothetical protein